MAGLQIDLSDDENTLKWSGLTHGNSWCRGSLITINYPHGFIGQSITSIDDLKHGNYFDCNRFRVESPTDLLEPLRNAKCLAPGCWKISFMYHNDITQNYILLLNVSLESIIKELEKVISIAELNGKKFIWV